MLLFLDFLKLFIILFSLSLKFWQLVQRFNCTKIKYGILGHRLGKYYEIPKSGPKKTLVCLIKLTDEKIRNQGTDLSVTE